MNAYYFSVMPAYGSTSIYVLGVMITAVVLILPPRHFLPLLLTNHAVFLAILLVRRSPATLLDPGLDRRLGRRPDRGPHQLAPVRGARGELPQGAPDFRHTQELHRRNEELARLHRLELDETAVARLAEQKARMEVLRYQLNPHFLFNALTSICAELPPEQTQARAAIERLADFCQLTLFRPAEGEREHPTLAQEMKMISTYLDIEQTRWGELLRVDFQVDPAAQAEKLPPFLLLPLVENALRYPAAPPAAPAWRSGSRFAARKPDS